ncbi:MAG: hypothetical protein WD294_04320 [Phycisphaeraceae bacterium]
MTVPTEAAGRTGRCPFCKEQFVVPDQLAGSVRVNDDIINDWLSAEDADDDAMVGGEVPHGEADASADATVSSIAEPEADEDETVGGRLGETLREHEADHALPLEDAVERADAPAEPAGESGEAPAEDAPQGEDDRAQRKRDGRHYKVESAIRPLENDEEEHRRQQQALYEQTLERRRRAGPSGHDEHTCNHARLSLLCVDAASVLLGFEANLLLRPAFRASLPMRCALCGETKRQGMVARPLAWADRGHGKPIPSGELETRYGHEVYLNQTPRDIVDHMPVIDELISPFNRAMPYYLCSGCAVGGKLICQAVDSPRGVLCEVTIPHTDVALEWVGRVNGICDDEYAQLEEAGARFDSDAWRQLSDGVRRRITAWFKINADEQFVAYVSDADFARKDAGLAGVALTDRRMVFCKYHWHGKLLLDDPDVTLLAVKEGPFYDLLRERQGTNQKLIRLRPDDLERLSQELERIQSPLRIMRADA